MTTNWQGIERGAAHRSALADLTADLESRPIAEAVNEAIPEPVGLTSELQHTEHGELAQEEPLVRGRRSSAILRKENIDDQLPPISGWQALVRAMTFGLINPKAGSEELRRRADIAAIQRIYSRPMMVMAAQPLGGVGKTTCSIGLGSTFGIHSALQTLVWDNNETMGTLGVRTNSNDSTRTVWDLLRVLGSFERIEARKGELSFYTRHQGNNSFNVLVSDEDPDRMKQIGVEEFNRLHTVLTRFYDTIIVDTANNTRSANWLAAIDVADQLVIPTTLKRNSVVSALRMIEQLESMSEHTGSPRYKELVANAVVLVTQGAGASSPTAERTELRRALDEAVRAVIDIPYDKALDTGSIIDWQLVGSPVRRAFERAAAAIADGLLHADAASAHTQTAPTTHGRR
ncbi:MinD/ParA family ATP-binding protein [Sinomonas sp. P47F7]|uniref:MinD/ParA family ATP-binding protein n=1 Tax=Sinomonas sp. P47F7 TaxID=3410987 RepID=UPI003BF4AB9F